MARGATAETSPSVWRYWAARLTLQRAILQERYSGLQGRRDRVEKRAVAAEIIAQEANAARLRALLDAAREQATVKTIESAEQRIADARGDWEAAHQAFSPPEEPDTDVAEVERTPVESSGDWPAEIAGALGPDRPKRLPSSAIFTGVIGTVVIAAIAIYLFRDQDVTVGTEMEARRAVPASALAVNAQPAPIASIRPDEKPVGKVVDMPPPVASVGEDTSMLPQANAAAPVKTEEVAPPAPPTISASASVGAVALTKPAQPKPHVSAKSAGSLTPAPTPGRNPFRAEAPPPAPAPAPVQDVFPAPRLYAD